MIPRFLALTSLLGYGLFGAVSAYAEDGVCDDEGDAGQVAAIRGQRGVFNSAIRHLDIATIGTVLAEDVILITGTDSDIFEGRETQLELWRSEGENQSRAIYERTPACVQVSPIFPVAMEYGTWHGGQSHAAASFASGSYAAKWRLTGDTWLLEIETYMTKRCGGSFCAKSEENP